MYLSVESKAKRRKKMKRKIVKRIVALLCVTAMVMTAFTACGNKPSKVDNSGTGEKT